jgi:hypothetical protein
MHFQQGWKGAFWFASSNFASLPGFKVHVMDENCCQKIMNSKDITLQRVIINSTADEVS